MTHDLIFEGKTISLKVPEYKYEFKFDKLPYYKPKNLCDLKDNIVDYSFEEGEFIAYKTKYQEGKASFVYENGKKVPLYPVKEKDIKAFIEDGIVQITDYNCGPAAALQTLDVLDYNGHEIIPVPLKSKKLWYGWDCCIDGDEDNTDTSNQRHRNNIDSNDNSHPLYIKCYREYTDRQIAVMDAMGTTWFGTPEAKSVAEAINQYFPGNRYRHIDINENRKDDLRILGQNIANNLNRGYPVNFMVNVKSLSFYKADNKDELARHYITGVGYESSKKGIEEDLITVIDPNYTYSRRGKYTLTLKELIYSMTQAGVDRNGNFIFSDETL